MSCGSLNTYMLYEKYYSLGETEEIKFDVFKEIKTLQADSIPLKDWKYMDYSYEDENQSRRIYFHFNEDEEIVFVLTTHETKDSTFYSFRIFLRTEDPTPGDTVK
jgi:hypothetical protein